jgi:hypothetical protein
MKKIGRWLTIQSIGQKVVDGKIINMTLTTFETDWKSGKEFHYNEHLDNGRIMTAVWKKKEDKK